MDEQQFPRTLSANDPATQMNLRAAGEGFGMSQTEDCKRPDKQNIAMDDTSVHFDTMMVPLTNAQLRALKAQPQGLKATVKVGKGGLSPQFLAVLDDALKRRDLVKVKFDAFKEQKKELAPQLAEKTGSHLVTRVGNVVVLFRPKAMEMQPG
jgi:RNA-binding protein